MENTQRPLQQANNFFYKFYNYNLDDITILSKVPDMLYGYVSKELLYYATNQNNSRMDEMQFNSFLYNLIKSNFTVLHEQLINDLKE